MENEKAIWRKVLDTLFTKCTSILGFFTRAKGTVMEPDSKAMLDRLSVKQAQMAYELKQHIISLAGRRPPKGVITFSLAPKAISLKLSGDNRDRLQEKSIDSVDQFKAEYGRALSKINDGSCRELLIRHRAILTGMIKEIKKHYGQLQGDFSNQEPCLNRN